METIKGLAEGQVLQRIGRKGAAVTLSGRSPATGPVLATLFAGRSALKGWKQRAVGEAKDRKFSASLEGIPAGGPYRLELHLGGKKLGAVRSFFVGDVWLLAGQSNMEGVGLISGAAKADPRIRAFSMRHEWRLATDPLHVLAESPDICHTLRQCTRAQGEKRRRNAVKGTGVGLFFAKEMLKRSGVPQGLVCTAHGGTSMDQWNPERPAGTDNSFYASMLSSWRATGQPVAGVLWYQGESDAGPKEIILYERRMRRLVGATRRDLGLPGLPWITVQISRVVGLRTAESNACWNRIQELQRLLPDSIKNLETVPAIDLRLEDPIHIASPGYERLGLRMARAADRLVHGAREKRPPQLESVSKLFFQNQIGHWIDVAFSDVVGGLRAPLEPSGFFIVDKDGNDLKAVYKTVLLGNVLRLHLAIVVAPGMAVTYGLGNMPVCNITDGRDESLPAFGPKPIRIPVARPTALLPFVRKWKVTKIQPASTPLKKIDAPDVEALGGVERESSTDFFEDHAAWQGKSGHVYFSSRITLPEAMRLDVLMGYDGPFRLWIGGKLLFQDLKGTNPAVIDERARTILLPPGKHDLRVAMDINEGRAWGFFLRFRRKELTPAQIASGNYLKPAYST